MTKHNTNTEFHPPLEISMGPAVGANPTSGFARIPGSEYKSTTAGVARAAAAENETSVFTSESTFGGGPAAAGSTASPPAVGTETSIFSGEDGPGEDERICLAAVRSPVAVDAADVASNADDAVAVWTGVEATGVSTV